jgi:hypothetical protein
MRPILKPGLRRLWHNGSTLQLGIDPARAVVVTDLKPSQAALLDALDGRRTLEQVRVDGGCAGRDLLDLLAAADLLDDAAPAAGAASLPPAERDRLQPDLAALSVRSTDPARPPRVLDARRAARVLVRGAGRVGAQIAALLAAAGIGRIVVDDPGVTTPADVSPGGLRVDDVGRPRALAAGAAMARVRRGAGQRPAGRGAPAASRLAEPAGPPGGGAHGAGPEAGVGAFDADLTVLAPVGPPTVAPDVSLDLERRGGAHLLAGVRETSGIVGPLVVPAQTACLHCQHLHRHAGNPVWPLLAMQLVRPRTAGHDPCEITLASLVAALTAMQALAYLDRAATAPPRTPEGPRESGTPSAYRPPRSAAPPGNGPGGGGSGKSDTERSNTTTIDTEIYDTSCPVPPSLPVTANGTLEFAVPDWRIRRRSWPVHPNCPCRSARSAAERAAADRGAGAV